MRRAIFTLVSITGLLWCLDWRLKKADYYILNHHKDGSYLAKATLLCEELLAESPHDAGALWRLASIHFTIGYMESDKSKKLACYDKALGYAERAKQENPSSPDVWFWYGTTLSGVLEAKGIIEAVNLAVPIKNAFQTALKKDPNHVESLAALARWYLEAPAIAGGDLDKAIILLEKALSVDPSYTVTHVALARAYIKKKKYPETREVLKKCLAVENPTCPAGFWINDKHQAEKLLADISGK